MVLPLKGSKLHSKRGFRRFARSTAEIPVQKPGAFVARNQTSNRRSIKSWKKPVRRLRKRGEWRKGRKVKGKIARNDERVCRLAERNGRQLISREILLLLLIFRTKLPTADVCLGKSPYTWIRAERVASNTVLRFRTPSSHSHVSISGNSGSLYFTMLRNSRRKFGSNELA